ncbi:hypothetical protein [Microvirga brassicacearum]|uniref:Lectin-like protein BA14k n=1 Tax=Microvirga brassicacearum TaxID=2580413 RepID=A0A5N3P8N5_9HYPH|nr:hypothetical protein [Microvirga brassicacearum]KAB0266090.1 hypothetical protein FEZ63_15125 [Microvirga brassicacearum]
MKVLQVVSGTVAALALVGGLAAAEPAAARDRFSPGAAAALGVLGGLAVGGAIAASQSPAYGAPVYYAPPPPPPPVYVESGPVYGEPVYYAPRPVYRRCFTERFSEWVPGWGWQPSRRTVCR